MMVEVVVGTTTTAEVALLWCSVGIAIETEVEVVMMELSEVAIGVSTSTEVLLWPVQLACGTSRPQEMIVTVVLSVRVLTYVCANATAPKPTIRVDGCILNVRRVVF
jgi:hypothetical protein